VSGQPKTGLSIFRLTIYLAIQSEKTVEQVISMEIDLSKLEVVHNPTENRFETWIDGNLSKLDYMQDEKNFVITHVGVHPSLRGQGVAGRMVEVSMAYARENSLRVVPMCSYAAAFIRRHPEYAELTRQDRAE
jgi:predicted GNAT family acetyltransferase